MRRLFFAGLVSVIVMASTANLVLTASVSEAGSLFPDVYEHIHDPLPWKEQGVVGEPIVVAQKTNWTKADRDDKNKADRNDKNKSDKGEKNKADKDDKNKPDKEVRKTADRADSYKCLEYCSVVRQSCEGFATIQPITSVAVIGSSENNEWSRECQKVYVRCINKCDDDQEKVHWKRVKFGRERNRKRESN